MSNSQRIQLRHYQREFVDGFLASKSDRVHLLVAPIGSGTGVCGVEIMSHIFEEKPDARVLILTERQVLQEQWRRRFSDAGIQARSLEGTRQNLREIWFNDQFSELVWPASTIVTMSAGSIQRFGDISRSVLDTDWDLVIWDWFTPSPGKIDVLEKMRSGVNFLKILVVTHDQSQHWARILPGAEQTVWDWSRMLSSYEPNPTVSLKLVELTYQHTPEEQEIRSRVNELTDNLVHIGVKKPSLTRLKRASDSSPLALREHLRQFQPSLAAIAVGEIPISEHLDSEDLDDDELTDVIDQISDRRMQSLTDVRKLQELVDDLTVDSKLEAIHRYIDDHLSDQSHVMIWCRFASTARYLRTALDEAARRVFLLLEEDSPSERLRVLGDFESAGGILVATFAAIRSLESSGDSIVLYDALPDAGRNALSALLQRAHNQKSVEVISFADYSETIKALHETVERG